MAFSSSLLIGLLISTMSAVTTAFDLPRSAKFALSGIGVILTLIPLLINFFVFLNSPFGRFRHLKNELYKLLLSDSYEQLNVTWTLKGKGVYCNQSMVPKAIIPPKVHVMIKSAEDGSEHSDQHNSFRIELSKDGEVVLRFTLDPLYSERRSTGSNLIIDSGSGPMLPEDRESFYRIFKKLGTFVDEEIEEFRLTIGFVEFALRKKSSVYSLVMTHCSGSQEIIDLGEPNDEQLYSLLFCLAYHGQNPESGILSSKMTYRRNIWETHSMSYQDLWEIITSDANPGHFFQPGYLSNSVCEGEDEDFLAVSSFLPESFIKTINRENIAKFCEHHVSFWGGMNIPALKYVIYKRTGLAYRSIGSNWKSKRYLIDVSYFFEMIGLCRFSCIDLKIKPTVLSRLIFKDLVKSECTGSTYIYQMGDTKKLEQEIKDKLKETSKSRKTDPETRLTLSKLSKNLNALNYLTRRKKGKESVKSLCDSIKMMSTKKQCTDDLIKAVPDRLPNCRIIPRDLESVKKSSQKVINLFIDSEAPAGCSEAVKKAVKTYKDALKVEVGVDRYIEDLKKSNMAWTRKMKVSSAMLNHEDGQIKFPLHPKRVPLKTSQNFVNRKVSNLISKIRKIDRNDEWVLNSRGKKARKPSILQNPIDIKNTYSVLMKYEESLNKQSDLEEINLSKQVKVVPSVLLHSIKKYKPDPNKVKRFRIIRAEKKKERKRDIIGFLYKKPRRKRKTEGIDQEQNKRIKLTVEKPASKLSPKRRKVGSNGALEGDNGLLTKHKFVSNDHYLKVVQNYMGYEAHKKFQLARIASWRHISSSHNF
jgi:hypothetical protein